MPMPRTAATQVPMATAPRPADRAHGATRALVPEATVLPSVEAPGAVLDAWIRANVEALRVLPDPVAYLAGNGPAIQRQRTLLRDVVGLDRRAVKTQPYWAEGRPGL